MFKSRSVQTWRTLPYSTPWLLLLLLYIVELCTFFFLHPPLHIYTREYFCISIRKCILEGGAMGIFIRILSRKRYLHFVRNAGQSKSETNSLLTGRTSKSACFQIDKKLISNEIWNHYGRRCQRFDYQQFFVIVTIDCYGDYRRHRHR